MLLKGRLAELMRQVDLQLYCKFVIYDKTIKHSYTLNYQRQYMVSSRALSFSTESLSRTLKITKHHSQSTHTTHALPTL
jgi:hypothetical protein